MTIPTPKAENIEAIAKLPTLIAVLVGGTLIVGGIFYLIHEWSVQEHTLKTQRAEFDRERTSRMMTLLEGICSKAGGVESPTTP